MGEFLEEDPLNPVSRGVLADNGDGLWDALAGAPESRPEYSETLVFGLRLGVVQNELNVDLGVLIAHGLKLAQDAPAEAAEQGLKLTRARLEREPVRKIPLGTTGSGKDGGVESAGSGGSAKQVIIQKVIIPADLKTIKDLRQLLEILKELESYSEANEDAEDDGDPDAALQPA